MATSLKDCLETLEKCLDAGDLAGCKDACCDVIDLCCTPTAAPKGAAPGDDQAVDDCCTRIRAKCQSVNLQPKGVAITPGQVTLIITVIQFVADLAQKWRTA